MMLYSTTTPIDEKAVAADANTYRPFKILDATITKSIFEELDSISENDMEGTPNEYSTLEKAFSDIYDFSSYRLCWSPYEITLLYVHS